ncbi:ABC transporter permease [Chloroherpeton thalassium]|uniref:ABC transporter permease n=1 Tax=Chloroherpeton thalassium TaxID=100716 RepID=UPI00145EFE38|nr:ABC transporter permease [Chloroherpeton thalassium]
MADSFLEQLGQNVRSSLRAYITFLSFAAAVIASFPKFFKQTQVGYLVLLRQVLFTGYEALSIVVLISVSIGGLIILEGYSILANFGQSDLLYVILVSVITRELSNLLTAFIIVARSGTAIATELGNMVVNHEIDALLSIGISPISYLVVPRTIGVVVSLLVLNVYFNITGILGGWMVSNWFYPIDFNVFFSKLLAKLTLVDISASILKSMLFGFAIAIISSFHGLQVNFASTEVPQRTIRAVVYSLTMVVIIDVAVVVLIYL